jgi:proteasome lid subunit RPN8/RPN11
MGFHFMLRMSASQLELMRRSAELEYPHECCGVLVGKRIGDVAEVAEVVECINASDATKSRYAIGAEELIVLQRESRERHLEIVGFYHSHPDHPADWSAQDLEDAYWTGCSYLIVAVEHGRAIKCASFLLHQKGDAKTFEAEEILCGEY